MTTMQGSVTSLMILILSIFCSASWVHARQRNSEDCDDETEASENSGSDPEQLHGAQYGIESVVLSKRRALVGDTLTATCDIRNEPASRILVYWVRATPSRPPQTVDISVNQAVELQFRATGRYSVGYVLYDGLRRIQFQLNITDLRTEDSGKLGCRLYAGGENNNFELLKDFAVTVPVQKVEWVLSLPSLISDSTSPVEKYEGVTSISVPEGDVRRFVCHVNGSFPQPQVKVFLGDRDVTSEFTRESRLVTAAGAPGLQPVYYEVQLTHDPVRLDHRYDHKTLTCHASLAADDVPPTLNSSSVYKNAVLDITLV